MPFSDILSTYELCFPGAVTGSAEVQCPHCGEVLTAPVDDPMGVEIFRCCECDAFFSVNWGRERVSLILRD